MFKKYGNKFKAEVIKKFEDSRKAGSNVTKAEIDAGVPYQTILRWKKTKTVLHSLPKERSKDLSLENKELRQVIANQAIELFNIKRECS